LRDDTITGFLGKLAERTAAPAGGATAALNAAMAAALIAMSARFCDGPRHAGQAGAIGEIVMEADRLRDACAELIAADGESYGPVLTAYALPKDTAGQRAARSTAISAALVTAAVPAAEVIAAAARLVELAGTLEPLANRSIAPDVAAAVEAIRSAVATSRTNIEANLSGITDPAARDRLTAVIAGTAPLEAGAAEVIVAIRTRYA
jgi:methenyltetrahydrofolate cyclohydrolase